MDETEKVNIRSALPESLLSPPPSLSLMLVQPDPHAIVTSTRNTTQRDLSLLHRFFASLVVQLFIAIQFLLPYIRGFIAEAYKYDREHHISKRMLSSSIRMADDIGASSLKYIGAICRLNDGKVGQAINNAAVWWIQGVAGGIHAGFGEGMVILGSGKNGKRGN